MGSRAGEDRRRRVLVPASLLVVALAAVLVLGSWSAAGDLFGGGADEAAETVPTEAEPSTETVPPGPVAPLPQVGDCRRLSWEDTDRDVTDAGSQPTGCRDAHTAQTFATGRLGGATGLDPATQPDRLVAAVSPRCRSALIRWLRADEDTYELSMFAYVVAVPTADDLAAGARWWRCDTYATERPGELATLRGTTRRVLAADSAARWATCVQGDLGPERRQVMCHEPHVWRAISAHRLGGRGEVYPGDDKVGLEIRTTCRDDVGAYVGDPLVSFDYGWLRPDATDWHNGQRFALCFARTRR